MDHWKKSKLYNEQIKTLIKWKKSTKTWHDLLKQCCNRGNHGKPSSLPYTLLVGQNGLGLHSTRNWCFQKRRNLHCVDRVKAKRKSFLHRLQPMATIHMEYDHYRRATFNLKIPVRKGRDRLFQLLWSEDSELFHSRTIGSEQVPEIRARNKDYEEEDGAFIFVSLFHQGLTC